MENVRVAVVILNWNGVSFLEKFLPNVLFCTGNDAEVIVVDNASTDNSVAFMHERFPDVRLILNSQNFGYAEGYNVALSQIDADYYVLLNSDVEVTPNWITPVINLMETDNAIAACQPKLLSYANRQELEYAGAGGGFIDKLGYPFCRGRLFQTLEQDHGQYDDTREIFWASGACMFVRTSAFWEAKGLDAAFFAHMEEIDFCWRVKNLGYRIMYCGASTIYHVGGGSLPKSAARKTYLNIRNNLMMLYKNLPDKELKKTFFKRFFLDGIAAIHFLLTSGSFKSCWAVARAHLAFMQMKKEIKKHRQCAKNQHVGQIYKGSVVKDYYLLGKRCFAQLDNTLFTQTTETHASAH
ncbi:MAG: glycosyltransferase family 2 protein [Bacteroidales bacterium]|nr:glycosyltransferase family 2 protein [Bacteroidales bacterium]